MCEFQGYFVLALYKVFHQPWEGLFSSESLRHIQTHMYMYIYLSGFKATVVYPFKNKILYKIK